jgi:excisionase family DNA binding protein
MNRFHPTTIDELIEDRVARGVEKALAPYLDRLAQTSTTNHDKASASEPLAYTVKDAARALGISRTKLYELMATGELSYTKVSSRRLIRRDVLVSLLDRHESTTTV